MNIARCVRAISFRERTHPEVLPVKSGDLRVRGPDLVKVCQERIHVVEALDTFVEGGHDRFRVLGQFHTRGLLFLCLLIPKLREHI